MSDSLDRIERPPAVSDRPVMGVLPRRLGVPALILLIVAFNAPIAAMAGFQQLAIAFGNRLGAPVAFLAAGAVLLLFAVGFVGMSRYSKNPGAYYRYIVDGLGKPPGLAGAFLATVAYTVMTAGAYVYLGLIFVDMTKRLFGEPVLNWQFWTILALVLITILGLLRIDLSMKVLGILVLVECVVVALWEFVVFLRGGPEGYATSSFAPSEFFSGSVGLGVLFAMLTMVGLEAAACFRDETRNPDKSVGRATYLGIGFLAVFYALGSWAYIITQGPSHAVANALGDPVGSFFNSVDGYLGGFFVHLVTVILVTSQIAAINASQGAASRYLFALGRDGVLSRRFARVHPRLESPYVAVLAVSVTSLVIVVATFLTGIDAVSAYAALTGAGIYFLLPLLTATSIAVIVFFRRNPELSPGPLVAIAAPAISAVALVVLFVLTTQNLRILAVTRTGAVTAEIGMAVVAVAGVLLALRYRRSRPEVYDRIGNP